MSPQCHFLFSFSFSLKQERRRFIDIKEEINVQNYKSPPKKRKTTSEVRMKIINQTRYQIKANKAEREIKRTQMTEEKK